MSKRVPKRRFKSFDGEWEGLKLSEIADKINEKNVKNLYRETLTNSAEYGIISQRDYFDKDISNKENTSAYYVVKPNDFVYNPRISANAPVGPINLNKLNRTGIMSPLYTVFRTHNIMPEYLECYFKSSVWHKYMFFYGDTGARADRFSIKDDVFMDMPIRCPANEEQHKVSEFFHNMENIIHSYQQKYDKLQALKKAYLYEMFPQEGESVPKRRFPEFSGEWEKKKMSEIISVNNGTDYKHLQDGDIPVYGTGGYMCSVNKALSYTEDAIGIGRKGTIDKPYILKAPFWTVDTLFYCIPCKGYNLHFVNDLFQCISWKTLDESTGVPSLSKTIIENVNIRVPSQFEQERIGKFFGNIDKNILKIQNKLQKLKALKQAYLAEMFV